ncbi:MAG: tyrosine-type recombinase/integrase [Chloroflexi bacterium]|nr:tyrosine-type recombinase/integrase [Chloroflexota bacterium]
MVTTDNTNDISSNALATIFEGEVITSNSSNAALTVVDRPRPRTETNPALVYLASLSETGRLTMRQKLNRVACLLSSTSSDTHDLLSFPWASLDYPTMQLLRTLLIEQAHYKPATANTCLTAVKRVLKECVRLKLMSNDEYQNATDLKAYKNDTLPRGRALSAGELAALMQAATSRGKPNESARNAAMVATLYGTGLRRSELINLALVDYDRDTGAITVRAGKGSKDRITYLGSTEPLDDWLTVRGSQPGPLILPVGQKDNVEFTRLSNNAVTYILQKLAAQAGIAAFSPHDLRRSFISDLLDSGADIATAQKLAGHASVTTTTQYDRRGEVTKKKAAGLLHLPYQRRAKAIPLPLD